MIELVVGSVMLVILITILNKIEGVASKIPTARDLLDRVKEILNIGDDEDEK